MHASLRIGDTIVMASDGACQGKPGFQGISLSLTVPNEAEADRRCNALADGGQVQMPLTKTFFSSRFGMVADRFGVSWMIVVAPSGRTRYRALGSVRPPRSRRPGNAPVGRSRSMTISPETIVAT